MPFRLRVAMFLVLLLLVPRWLPAPAQEPAGSADGPQERLERVVYGHPRPGTAFDLWIDQAIDAGALDALLLRVASRAERDANDPSAQLVRGMVCLRLGRLAEAAAALERAARLDPQNPQPLLLQSEIAARESDTARAVERIEAAIGLAMPADQWLAAHRGLARLYLRAGRTADATRTLTRVADRFPGDAALLAELAELLAEESRDALSVEMWQRVARLATDDPFRRVGALVEIAQLEWRGGDRAAGLRTFSHVLDQLRPDSWHARDVYRRIEHLFLEGQDAAGLVDYFERELARRPDDVELQLVRARALSLAGRHRDAAGCYRAIVDRAPDRRDVRERLVEEYLRAGRADEALAAGRELAARHPGDVPVWKRLGELCLAGGLDRPDVPSAIEAWRTMAGIRPDDPGLAVMAADACQLAAHTLPGDHRQPLLEAAEAFYREAIEREPARAELHEYLGDYLHARGRIGAAKDAWRRAAELPAESADAWRRLAAIYAAHGLDADAVDASRRAVELEPQRFDAVAQHVARLLAGDQLEAADAYCEQLIDLAETGDQRDLATVRRVDVWERQGRVLARIEAYADRDRTEPLAARERLLFATLLDRAGRFGEAARQVDRALQDEGDRPAVVRLYVDILCRADQAAAAISQLERLVELEPGRAFDYQRQIVELELALDRPAEARAAAGRLVAMGPGNPASHRLAAAISRRFGTAAEMIDALRRGVALAPRDIELRLELASDLAAAGRLEEAAQHHWRVFELATRQEDRELILSVLCQSVSSAAERDHLIDRLELQRRRDADPKPATLCLVHALRALGDAEAAARELDRAVSQFPTDADYLRLKISLLEQRDQWQAAAALQSRIVDLAPTAAELERLASLLDLAGQHAHASEILARLMRDVADDRGLAVLVESHARNGEVGRAREILQYGLERWPDSWLLRWQSGQLHLAEQQWDAAAGEFRQLVLAGVDPAATSTGEGVPDEISEFDRARRAADEWALQAARFQAGTPSPAERRWPRLRPHDDPRDATYVSAVGMLELAGAERAGALARDEQVTPAVLRVLTVCAAAAGNSSMVEFAERLERIAPQDARPHVARVCASATQVSPATEAAALIGRIDQSLAWIRLHRGDLHVHVLPYAVENLVILGGHDRLADLVMNEIAAATRLKDFDPIQHAILHLEDPEVQRRFLVRAAELVEAESHHDESRLLAILELLLNRPVPMPEDDEAVSAWLVVVDRLLATSRLSSGSASVSLHTSPAVLQSRLARLADEQQAVMRAPDLTDDERRRQAFLVQQRMTRVQTLRGVGVGHPATQIAADFPCPTTLLRHDTFRLLHATADATRDRNAGARLIELLERRAADESDADAANYAMALATVLWWGDQRHLAATYLDRFSDRWPGQSALRLAAAAANAHLNQLARTLYHLNRLDTASATEAERGRRLRDDALRRWSVTAIQHELKGHRGVIHGVAFSSDSRRLASAGVDRQVHVWSPADGSLQTRLSASSDMLLDVAFRPGTDTVATSGYDPLVELTRVSTGERQRPLDRHRSAVRSLAFSADGSRLATAGDDGLVVLWELSGPVAESLLTLTIKGVSAVALSPDGQRLAAGCRDGTLVIHDLQSGAGELAGHGSDILCLAFSGTGSLLASSGTDRMVRLWNVAEREMTFEFQPDGRTVRALDVSHDGRLVVAAGDAGIVHLWDLKTGHEKFAYSGHAGTIRAVAFSPDGKMIASAGNDAVVMLWKADAMEELLKAQGN